MPFLFLLPPWDANHNRASVHLWRSLDTGSDGICWDGICLPILALPHLALPYIQILSSTSMSIPQVLPTRSFKHVPHPPLHSGVSAMAAWSQTLPSSPTLQTGGGPTGGRGGKHPSWGLFTT